VTVEEPGDDLLILDLGTGLRPLGEHQPTDGSFRGNALITHLHWDHVQGLPFFAPVDRPGARLDVYGPDQVEGPLSEVFGGFMRPPYFPVHFSELRGEIRFHDVSDNMLSLGSAKVRVLPVPHCGPTVGYRVEVGGQSLAYVSDHQAPAAFDRVDQSVLELCDGVDLLIHDAQFTTEEFREKPHWGHSTIEYAVFVGKEAGAKRLALFHHDPAHGDELMDRLADDARHLGAAAGLREVLAATEGLSLELGVR
jgi:phosphoribosyl 1,2-cyclic phosphodiesterase